MNPEIAQIFKEQQQKSDRFLQTAITKAEDETKFILTGEVNVTNEAEKEMKELKEKIKVLKGRMRKFKNIKNHRNTTGNKGRRENRKKIKLEISECQLRIEEISKELDSYQDDS